jgi:uncharacterized repeat protein (TIGR03833 family)
VSQRFSQIPDRIRRENTEEMTPQKDGRRRSDISNGDLVMIVLKQDQRTGKLTEGRVQEILTNSATHPHGIKVRLEDGRVGRVRQIR